MFQAFENYESLLRESRLSLSVLSVPLKVTRICSLQCLQNKFAIMAIKLESVYLIGVLYYTLILALGKLDFKLNTLVL